MFKRVSLCLALLIAACSAPPSPPPVTAEGPAPAIARFHWFVSSHDSKAPPDEVDNPILPGFYPDPSIVRAGGDYYLVNSTFTYFPGLPIFHSRDMMHWDQIGNAIDRPEQVNFDNLTTSRGLYAPSIDYHDGVFVIVNTCVDCGDNFLITAAKPEGPWSDPLWLGFKGIDPSLFFDRDGKAYIVNNGPPEGTPLYSGHRAIWIQAFDWASKTLVGPRRVIVNGGTDIRRKPIWIEGPHLFRKGRWYYLVCAEGGTGDQHSEVVFRSRKVWGPYRPYRANPILTQRDLDPARPSPITSTGHAQLIYAGSPNRSSRQPARLRPSGSGAPASAGSASEGWWAVFLGTRPYSDDMYNTGRETFLLPVSWKDGWPVILPKGKPVPQVLLPAPARPDGTKADTNVIEYPREFPGEPLRPEWLFIRTPHEKWYSIANNTLNITPRPVAIGSTGQPSFIGARQQYAEESFTASLDFAPTADGERAGLVAFQNNDFFYFFGLVRENGKTDVCVTKRAGADDPEKGVPQACTPAPEGELALKIVARGPAYDFFYGTAGEATSQDPADTELANPHRWTLVRRHWTAVLRDADGTILSTKKAGGFVGTVIGMYAYAPQRD